RLAPAAHNAVIGFVSFIMSLMGTHFRNVDLEIDSKSDLQPLVTALGKKVFVLFVGCVKRTYIARLELAVGRPNMTADQTTRALCALICSLPRAERKLWNQAKRRDFSVGIQSEEQPSAVDFALEAETLKAVADLAARIVFTVYGRLKPHIA